MRRIARAVLAALLSTAAASLAGAAERRPVPALTIYPGDVIRDQMLTDADFADGLVSAAFAANRTLLPGQPIPTVAVAEPRLVTIGARVRLVFQEDGLVISTYASALQAGGAGDFVTVRNLESGITIGGTVAGDGSVHVGPS